MISFMKDAGDMALIGPVLKEQQKIIDSSIDKKLQLSKLISTITSKSLESNSSEASLNEDIKESISELIRNHTNDNDDTNITYKL